MKKDKEKVPLSINTPLFSLKALLLLLDLPSKTRGDAIAALITVADEVIKLKTGIGSQSLVNAQEELLINQADTKTAAVLKKLAAEAESNMDSFLRDQERIFYSLSDAVQYMIDNKFVPAKLVKAMLGGKWPNHPFGFEQIGSYMMAEEGTLAPDDGTGIEAPGPDFQLQFKLIHDPLHPEGSVGDR